VERGVRVIIPDRAGMGGVDNVSLGERIRVSTGE
jgi:hypothetical protein